MVIFISIFIVLAILIILFPASGLKLRNYLLQENKESSYKELLMSRIIGLIALVLNLYVLFNIYLIQQ